MVSYAESGRHPADGYQTSVIMRKHGHGQIFGPGRADGPFPEHYEPLECPVEKNYLSSVMVNPTAVVYSTKADGHATCDPRFPFVGTTYRVSEHWQTGLMTRPQEWLMELQPNMFVEMSEELAKLRGIQNGERVKVASMREPLKPRQSSPSDSSRFKSVPPPFIRWHSLALRLALAGNRHRGNRQSSDTSGRGPQYQDS